MAVSARENAAVRTAVRVPAWAWVVGIVLVSSVFYYLLGRRMAAPFILTDELLYSEAAKSFAAHGDLFVRDHSWVALAPVYPVLISPAWAIFTHVPDAYAAAKLINSLVMSLAAVPAYLLARRVLSQPFALATAALSVAVPSMLYTGTIMTENAFYPAFLGSALALVLVLEKPTFPRTLLLIALSVLTFFCRAQAVALIPAILTAPLLVVLVRRAGWEGLKGYWRLYGLTALVLVPPILVQLARGHSLTGLFGRYSFVSDQDYPPGAVAKWFVYHIAELDLYTGVLPFAALILLVVLARRLPAAAQAFLAATVALGFWLLLEVAAVDQTTTSFVNRVEERNIFYLVPLLVVALLLWIERGMPRPRPWAIVAAAVAAAFPILLPLQWMLNVSLVSDTLGLIPWWRLDLLIGSAGWTRAILAVCCLAAGAALPPLARAASLRHPRCAPRLLPGRDGRRRARMASRVARDVQRDREPAARLDRPRTAFRRAGRHPLHQPRVADRDLGERVLQPVGRVGLLPGRADPRGPARVARPHRRRRSRARTGARPCALRARRRDRDACRPGARERRRPPPAPGAG